MLVRRRLELLGLASELGSVGMTVAKEEDLAKNDFSSSYLALYSYRSFRRSEAVHYLVGGNLEEIRD